MDKIDYYDRKEVSNSDIQLLLTSPLHYLKKQKRKTTPAMEFGTNFHSYFLEPEKFANQTIITDLDLTTKDGKKVKAEALESGKRIIKQDEFNKIVEMRNSLIAHPLSFIFNGNIEVETEIYFNWDGIDCRSKLDLINNDIETIVDLKTIADCSKAENSVKYDYTTQGVFYEKAVYEETGKHYDFVFAFVEKESPFGVKFITVSNDTKQRGFDMIMKGFDIFKNIDNIFHGYSQDFIEV